MLRQEKLFKDKKLRLDKTPLLRPLAEFYKSVTGRDDYHSPVQAMDAVDFSMGEKIKSIEKVLAQIQNKPQLLRSAPELGERAMINCHDLVEIIK